MAGRAEGEGRGAVGESVTMRDVAKRAGVSVGTVSRVLGGHLNVAVDLRERVMRVATEMRYRPARAATAASSPSRGGGRARSAATTAAELGFLLTLPHLPEQTDLMTPFWASILQGAERAATAQGASVSYRSLAARSGAALRRLLEQMRWSGVLLVGVASEETIETVRRAGLPVVLVDHRASGVAVDAVVADYVRAGELVTERLVAAGHRRIAFIGGPSVPGSAVRGAIPTIEDRAVGYRTALAYAGLPVAPELVERCDLTPRGGYEAARRLLAADARFTAVFCVGDRLASGVLRALREGGLDVPADVSLVSVDDEFGGQAVPPLTTVRIAREAMGEVAVRRLLEIASADQPSPLTIVVPVALMERESIAPPPRR